MSEELTINQMAREFADKVGDSRFDVLRGEHLFTMVGGMTHCDRCHWQDDWPNDAAAYCLRTDMEALIRAAGACGYQVGVRMDEESEGGIWWATVEKGRGYAMGRSPEEAAWRAFYCAEGGRRC